MDAADHRLIQSGAGRPSGRQTTRTAPSGAGRFFVLILSLGVAGMAGLAVLPAAVSGSDPEPVAAAGSPQAEECDRATRRLVRALSKRNRAQSLVRKSKARVRAAKRDKASRRSVRRARSRLGSRKRRLKQARRRVSRRVEALAVACDRRDALRSGRTRAACDLDQLAARLVAPGCALLFEDTGTRADAEALWGELACAARERHELGQGGGDLHLVPAGIATGDDAFRRLRVLNGDDVYGQRCEVGVNDHRTGPTVLYGEGDRRVTFISFRLTDDFPAESEAWQLVMQMKQAQPAANGGGTPVLALNIYGGRWRVHQSTSRDSSYDTREIWSAPATLGRWVRFAFDIGYSSDPAKGFVRILADLNGDGDALDSGESSPRINTFTLKREAAGGTKDGIPPGGSIPSHLRVGIYNDPETPCPAPNGCEVEVDNVHVVGVE